MIDFSHFVRFLTHYLESGAESTYKANNTGLVVGIAVGVTAIVCAGAVLLMLKHSRRESVATARKKSEGICIRNINTVGGLNVLTI